MLKFRVETDWNADEWVASNDRAEHAVAVQIEKDTRPFVPARTLSLSNQTRVGGKTEVEGNSVIYHGPYARFLYYGKVMVDPETGSSYAPKSVKKVVTDKNLVFNTSVHPQAQAFWFEASKAQNLEKWMRVYRKARKHNEK